MEHPASPKPDPLPEPGASELWPPKPEDDPGLTAQRIIATRALVCRRWPLTRYLPNTQFHPLGRGLVFLGFGLPGPSFNCVAAAAAEMAPGETPADFPCIVALIHENVGEVPGGYGILVEADTGHPLEAELIRIGCAVAESEPALIWSDPDPGDWEHWCESRMAPARITPARTEADLAMFGQVTAEVFQTPIEFANALTPNANALADPDLTFFYVWDPQQPDRPVGTVGVNHIEDVSVSILFGLAVLPHYRNRGYGAALTRAAAHWTATQHRCRHLALRASPDSFPLYRKLGFRHVATHRVYVPPASAPPEGPPQTSP